MTVHGRYSLIRNTALIMTSLYKNMAFFFPQFWFAFFSGYSSQTTYDDWIITFYNITLTSLPPLFLAFFEKDISENVIAKTPEAFRWIQSGKVFTMFVLTRWLLSALFHSVIIFFFTFVLFTSTTIFPTDGLSHGLRLMNGCMATIGLIIIWTKIATSTNYWPYPTFVGYALSILSFLVLFAVTSNLATSWPQLFSVFQVLYGIPAFWLLAAIALAVALLPDLLYDIVQREWFPQDWQILQEKKQSKQSNQIELEELELDQ